VHSTVPKKHSLKCEIEIFDVILDDVIERDTKCDRPAKSQKNDFLVHKKVAKNRGKNVHF